MKALRLLLPLLFALPLASPARAQSPDLHLGGRTVVAAGSALTEDVICLFCQLEARGEIEGNLLVVFGSVQLGGQAHQDVFSVLSHVRATTGAQLSQDLVSVLSWTDLERGVTVGADAFNLLSALSLSVDAQIEGGLTGVFDWLSVDETAHIAGRLFRLPAWLLLLCTPLLGLYVMFHFDEKRAAARRNALRAAYLESGRKAPRPER